MTKKIIFLHLFFACMVLVGCSDQRQQLGCNEKNTNSFELNTHKVSEDFCKNYRGLQSFQQTNSLGFIAKNNSCFLEYNHAAYARTGLDRVKINRFLGDGEHIALIDLAKPVKSSDFKKSNTQTQSHAANIISSITHKKHGTAIGVNLHFFGVLGNDALTASKNKYYQAIETMFASDTDVAAVIYPNNLGWNFLTQDKELKPIIDKIKHTDTVHVFSAGNANQNLSEIIDSHSTLNGKLYSIHNIELAEKLLYVGSFDIKKNQLASHSGFPGQSKMLQSRFLVSVGEDLNFTHFVEAETKTKAKTKNVSGTSYAAPQVASAIAILKAIDKSLTAVEATNILLNTANKNLPEYYKECKINHINYNCGELMYGQGLLDVESAVAFVLLRLKQRCATINQ